MNRAYTERMPAALILAGGKGRRLMPLTEHCPKPLLPVAGVPLLFLILQDLRKQGITRIGVLACYGEEQLRKALEEERSALSGLELRVIGEERPMGSAGCLWGAQEMTGERFFVVCGDVYGKRDYRGMLSFHLEKGAFASLFLTKVSRPVEYGLVRTAVDGRIDSFLEKPTWSQTSTDLANGGVYLFEKEVLSFISRHRPSDFGKDVFPALLAAGKPLYGFQDGGYWQDVGDRRAYLSCNLHASGGKTVVGRDCILLGRAERSVLFDGVRVEENCLIEGSVLGRGCVIGRGSVVKEGCVLGDGCVLQEGCILEEGTVLQGGSLLSAGSHLKRSGGVDGLHFEEDALYIDGDVPEEGLIRLGYASAAGGSLLLMHDQSAEGKRACRALWRGAGLAGCSPCRAGEGFYAFCGGLTAVGGFSCGIFAERDPRGGCRLRFLDRAGLPANALLVRKIRDRLAGAVICGRVGKKRDFEETGRAIYRSYLLLCGEKDRLSFTLGLEGTGGSFAFLSDLLLQRGCTLVPYGKGELNLYLSPDGRRCSAMQRVGGSEAGREIHADFWHLLSVVLRWRKSEGEELTALPDRAPDALFALAREGQGRLLHYPLCGAVPVDEEVLAVLKRRREALDGLLLLLSLLTFLKRTGMDLEQALSYARGAHPFAVVERGMDCAPEEKLPLLLFLQGDPAGEGVRQVRAQGSVRVRARGGRGLFLMAEAASESDARSLLEDLRRTLLEQKRKLREGGLKEETEGASATLLRPSEKERS